MTEIINTERSLRTVGDPDTNTQPSSFRQLETYSAPVGETETPRTSNVHRD